MTVKVVYIFRDMDDKPAGISREIVIQVLEFETQVLGHLVFEDEEGLFLIPSKDIMSIEVLA